MTSDVLHIKKEQIDVEWEENSNARDIRDLARPKRRGRPSKNAPYTCAICNFETHNIMFLNDHTASHENKSVFSCPHCPVMFSQKGNLQAHIRTHTKERPFTCELCPFSAAQRGNLLVHQRKHTKEKPYRCNFCDFDTAQMANLRSHQIRKHAISDVPSQIRFKVKIFSCTFCNFVCRRKAEVTKHCQISHADLLAATLPPLHFMDLSTKR